MTRLKVSILIIFSFFILSCWVAKVERAEQKPIKDNDSLDTLVVYSVMSGTPYDTYKLSNNGRIELPSGSAKVGDTLVIKRGE